jgi:hypothetical protein
VSYVVPPEYVPPATFDTEWHYFVVTQGGLALPASGSTVLFNWAAEAPIKDTGDITYDPGTGQWTVPDNGTYQIEVNFLVRSGAGSGSGWGLPNVVNCTIGCFGIYSNYPQGEAASSDGPVNVYIYRDLRAGDTIQMKCNYNLTNPFVKSGWWSTGGIPPTPDNYVSWVRIVRIA